MSGDVARPGIYEYAFGVSVRQVLEDAGATDPQAVQVGAIRPGDALVVVSRPEHGFTVPNAFAAWCRDHEMTRGILDAAAGAPEFREELAGRLPGGR